MRIFYASACFLAAALAGQSVMAQTRCGSEHTGVGAFICYPNPQENLGDVDVPETFHLSAQANAPAGRRIRRYVVLIDGHRIYEKLLALPSQQISIETNIRSPFRPGTHTLGLYVDNAGSTETKGLHFRTAPNIEYCDPFSRVDAGTCLASSIREPLQWTPTATPASGGPETLFDRYRQFLTGYSRNLKSMEADIADAVALDAQNNLYLALHSFAGVELRKFSPNGSLIYDGLVQACGSGFTSVTALAIDEAGHAWVAGNTTACLPASGDAFLKNVDNARPHGFVLCMDTTKPGSTAPLFLTYLSSVENRIRGIRVDRQGNAYLAGVSTSSDFVHHAVLRLEDAARVKRPAQTGFVSVLNASGSGLRWSSLLESADIRDLAIDQKGAVHVTGRTQRRSSGSEDVFVATLSAAGDRLPYQAIAGTAAREEGLAIAATKTGKWLAVAGLTESGPSSAATPLLMAMQPCSGGAFRSQILSDRNLVNVPELAIRPALDAFVAKLDESSLSRTGSASGLPATVHTKTSCDTQTP